MNNTQRINKCLMKTTKLMTVRLHLSNDKDIIDRLESSGNKNGYIKKLIRQDIAKENEL